mmetsp:Transcript_16777/g.50264  ORF Transcript_16777/g.50264 Transcript_16777/m.50264 type:complete len:223 (-) Transcript_16777:270-938(-)
MEDIIKDIAKPHALHHPPDGCVQDRSAPHPPRGYHLEKLDRSPLLHDIQAGVPLVHPPAGAVHDRSTPVIDTSTHLEPTHHKELLAEVQAEGAHSAVMHELKHKFVEDASGGGLHLAHPPQACVHDRSAPHPPAGYHLEHVDKQPLLHDIQHGVLLAHPPKEAVHDRSNPVIDSNVHLQSTHHKELLCEVVERGSQQLVHPPPGTIHDRSAPMSSQHQMAAH